MVIDDNAGPSSVTTYDTELMYPKYVALRTGSSVRSEASEYMMELRTQSPPRKDSAGPMAMLVFGSKASR